MSVPGRSCRPSFSPQGHFNQVPLGQVQQQLRAGFRRWGLPEALRVDNGSPWGSWSDLPPPLALWLVGLGLRLLWNPPRRPQANGVVERSHGVAQAWAEPRRCGYFGPQGWLDCDVINRSELKAPHAGPCIVEEYDATCLVPPGWTARLDRYGNIVMRRTK